MFEEKGRIIFTNTHNPLLVRRIRVREYLTMVYLIVFAVTGYYAYQRGALWLWALALLFLYLAVGSALIVRISLHDAFILYSNGFKTMVVRPLPDSQRLGKSRGVHFVEYDDIERIHFKEKTWDGKAHRFLLIELKGTDDFCVVSLYDLGTILLTLQVKLGEERWERVAEDRERMQELIMNPLASMFPPG